MQVDDFDTDASLLQVLNLLPYDITVHPERLVVIDRSFVVHLTSLVDGIEVDLNSPLSPDDE